MLIEAYNLEITQDYKRWTLKKLKQLESNKEVIMVVLVWPDNYRAYEGLLLFSGVKCMKIDPSLIEWLEKCIVAKENGDVGLIFHMRDGKIEWIEKINRTTEKPENNSF